MTGSGLSRGLVRRFDHQITEVNPFDAGHAEAVAAIQAEKLAFQLAECQKRVDKFPTDLAIRFEMGALHFQAGKIGEATSCSIYAVRPEVCRTCMPGDPECAMARKRHGLPVLG